MPMGCGFGMFFIIPIRYFYRTPKDFLCPKQQKSIKKSIRESQKTQNIDIKTPIRIKILIKIIFYINKKMPKRALFVGITLQSYYSRCLRSYS